jgi:hypothetical protein
LIFFYQVSNDDGYAAISSLFAVDKNVGKPSIFLNEFVGFLEKLSDIKLNMVFNLKVKVLRDLFLWQVDIFIFLCTNDSLDSLFYD